MNETSLRIGFAAYVRLVVYTMLVGGFVGALAVAGIVGSALDELARLESPGDPYAYGPASQRDAILGVLIPALLASAAILPVVCLRLRSGRGARVRWDATGVTEWEGDTVRTFIPRAAMRVGGEHVTSRRSRRGRTWTFVSRSILQISDDAGRRITLGYQSPFRAFFVLGLPLWMRRRPALTSWEGLSAILAAVPKATPEIPVVPDARSARRPLAGLSIALHFLALALGGLALWMINTQHSAAVPAGVALIAASIALGLAVLRPLGELVAIFRAGRALSRAQPVTFRSEADGALTVVLADGRALAADASAVQHPDAWVVSRGQPLRAVLDVANGGDAYRGAMSRARVLAVETAAERSERLRVLAADVAEIHARLFHALLVFTIGVLIVTRIQGF